MTPEKRYEKIVAMICDYDKATGNNAAKMIVQNPQEWTKSTLFPFYANAAEMLIECKTAMDGKTAGKGITSAVNRIYKDCAAQYNKALRGKYEATDDDGKTIYFLCNGHMIIAFYEDFSSVPKVPEADKMPEKNLIKFLKYEDPEKVYIDLPTVADIKAAKAANIAQYGRKEKKPVHIGNGIYVNPDYVLNIMQALPNCTAWTNGKRNAPIFFEAENGKAMLLPVAYHPERQTA